jgi:hypothetical protein
VATRVSAGDGFGDVPTLPRAERTRGIHEGARRSAGELALHRQMHACLACDGRPGFGDKRVLLRLFWPQPAHTDPVWIESAVAQGEGGAFARRPDLLGSPQVEPGGDGLDLGLLRLGQPVVSRR